MPDQSLLTIFGWLTSILVGRLFGMLVYGSLTQHSELFVLRKANQASPFAATQFEQYSTCCKLIWYVLASFSKSSLDDIFENMLVVALLKQVAFFKSCLFMNK